MHIVLGDCGFDPSRCTVECDLRQVVHAHLPLSPSIIFWYQHKLGSKQAHCAAHALAASCSWCPAEGHKIGDQRRPTAKWLGTNFTFFHFPTCASKVPRSLHRHTFSSQVFHVSGCLSVQGAAKKYPTPLRWFAVFSATA